MDCKASRWRYKARQRVGEREGWRDGGRPSPGWEPYAGKHPHQQSKRLPPYLYVPSERELPSFLPFR